MHIAIINLTIGGLSWGYIKYLRNIIPLLQNQPEVKELKIYMPPNLNKNIDKFPFDYLQWPHTDYWQNYKWLKDTIEKEKPDVIFIPTARYLKIRHVPTVVMIHNMEALTIPVAGNPFMEAIKNVCRSYFAKMACFKATRIIAVSKYTKNYLINRWQIEPEKIGVVYHGVDIPSDTASYKIPEVAYGLQSAKFIFTAGTIRPARGLEDLLIAFKSIYSEIPGLKLVIAGSTDPFMKAYKSKLDSLINKLGIADFVYWTGFLSEREMSWCYRNCSAFIMTSRAEACPNTVLEAMAHGCICISTETLPMPEFFEDVAVYYPPGDARALGEAIKKVFSWDKERRRNVFEKARNRASQFSWDICAEKTVKQLKMAVQDFLKHKRTGTK